MRNEPQDPPSRLLERLYAGLDAPKPWQDFLEALRIWLDASFATLIITASGRCAPGTFVTPGSDPDFNRLYFHKLFIDDPFKGLPDGEVTHFGRFMDTLDNGAHHELREALRACDCEQILGLDLQFGSRSPGSGGRSRRGAFEARLRVSRRNQLPDFTPLETMRLKALVPHLRIAVGLFEKLQFADAQTDVFRSTTDGLGLGFIVLDRTGRIASSNLSADCMLQQAEGLQRTGDTLAFDRREHRLLLDRLLKSPAHSDAPHRFRIERPHNGDIIVTARTLNLQAIDGGPGALALMLVRPRGTVADSDPAAARPDFESALPELLGLTPAEARLAMTLAEGLSLVATARKLGISPNTAKAQLRAVFAKTNVNRQSQLVALLSFLNT